MIYFGLSVLEWTCRRVWVSGLWDRQQTGEIFLSHWSETEKGDRTVLTACQMSTHLWLDCYSQVTKHFHLPIFRTTAVLQDASDKYVKMNFLSFDVEWAWAQLHVQLSSFQCLFPPVLPPKLHLGFLWPLYDCYRQHEKKVSSFSDQVSTWVRVMCCGFFLFFQVDKGDKSESPVSDVFGSCYICTLPWLPVVLFTVITNTELWGSLGRLTTNVFICVIGRWNDSPRIRSITKTIWKQMEDTAVAKTNFSGFDATSDLFAGSALKEMSVNWKKDKIGTTFPFQKAAVVKGLKSWSRELHFM